VKNISPPLNSLEGFCRRLLTCFASLRQLGVREVQVNCGFYAGKLNLPDPAKRGESSRAVVLNEKKPVFGRLPADCRDEISWRPGEGDG